MTGFFMKDGWVNLKIRTSFNGFQGNKEMGPLSMEKRGNNKKSNCLGFFLQI